MISVVSISRSWLADGCPRYFGYTHPAKRLSFSCVPSVSCALPMLAIAVCLRRILSLFSSASAMAKLYEASFLTYDDCLAYSNLFLCLFYRVLSESQPRKHIHHQQTTDQLCLSHSVFTTDFWAAPRQSGLCH